MGPTIRNAPPNPPLARAGFQSDGGRIRRGMVRLRDSLFPEKYS
jgi:hypothetical protein